MVKKERVDKVLANLGCGSRKEIKKLCKNGEVTIDGEIIKDNTFKFDPENCEIKVKGEKIIYREFVYLMMNKPQDVVSATHDNMHETVIDLIDDEFKAFDPFPIGRLDKDTEGFLLISNDGKLAHKLLSPKKQIGKTYYAEVEGKVTEDDVESFKEGVYIDDNYKTLPAKLKILESGEISKIELTIMEGKFHQVKRMFHSVDKEVIYLKRQSMGILELDNSLELGEYRELSKTELQALLESVK